jgi:pimeloyl-[acyl-carrier protein] methyl ester esterase
MNRIYLLRGLVRESAHWNGYDQKLKSALPNNWEVGFLEIPGVGKHLHVPSPNSLEAMVEFMRETHLDEIKSSGTKIILALSLGGMLAKAWVDKYPDDFDGLILVNTSFRGINPLLKRLLPASVLSFTNIFFTPNMPKREGKIIKMVSNHPTDFDAVHAHWVKVQEERPVTRKNFLNQLAAAMKYKTKKNKPNQKILFLAGKKDRLCHYENSIQMNQLWGGELKIHPTAGHDLPIDDASWMNTEINQWLEGRF